MGEVEPNSSRDGYIYCIMLLLSRAYLNWTVPLYELSSEFTTVSTDFVNIFDYH